MTDDRWSPYQDEPDEQLALRALEVPCPRCGREAGQSCYSWSEHASVPAHPSRVAAALAAGR